VAVYRNMDLVVLDFDVGKVRSQLVVKRPRPCGCVAVMPPVGRCSSVVVAASILRRRSMGSRHR
jgi:hypothetical protein